MNAPSSPWPRPPRWIDGTANRVVCVLCIPFFLFAGVWAAVTAPGDYLDERQSRAAGPPVEATAGGQRCQLVVRRGSRCSTLFHFVDRDGQGRHVRLAGGWETGTTFDVYPSLGDRRKVYRADQSCCAATWNVALAAAGTAGGLALTAGLFVRRRSSAPATSTGPAGDLVWP